MARARCPGLSAGDTHDTDRSELTIRHVMSTRVTIAHHDPDAPDAANGPSWHLYEEALEAGVVYLELAGVNVTLHTRDEGRVDVVVRLPVGTARQLGLHTSVPAERWALAGQSVPSLRGTPGKPGRPVPTGNLTQACAEADVCATPAARVERDPARGLLVGTFDDGVIIESGDPGELAERMFAHGARAGHLSTPDPREGDTALPAGHRIVFYARLNHLGHSA